MEAENFLQQKIKAHKEDMGSNSFGQNKLL